MFGGWAGYKWSDSKMMERPWFQVRKCCKIFSKEMTCHVILGPDKANSRRYRIVCLAGKAAFKIIDGHGAIIAEVCLNSNIELTRVSSSGSQPLDTCLKMALIKCLIL